MNKHRSKKWLESKQERLSELFRTPTSSETMNFYSEKGKVDSEIKQRGGFGRGTRGGHKKQLKAAGTGK